jgi:hypothetical protein
LNEIISGPENEFVTDPLSDGVWDTWTSQASRTQRRIGCYYAQIPVIISNL